MVVVLLRNHLVNAGNQNISQTYVYIISNLYAHVMQRVENSKYVQIRGVGQDNTMNTQESSISFQSDHMELLLSFQCQSDPSAITVGSWCKSTEQN